MESVGKGVTQCPGASKPRKVGRTRTPGVTVDIYAVMIHKYTWDCSERMMVVKTKRGQVITSATERKGGIPLAVVRRQVHKG